MKKTSQILIAAVLLLISNTFYGQVQHTITLNVDTANLTKDNVTSESITSFSAPDTQIDIASPAEAFTITVDYGSTITWEGVSTSSDDDTVEIFMIKWEKGPRIFGPNDLEGNGKVQGVVNGETSNEPFKYQILFKVNGEGRMYQIDPKIKLGAGN